MSDAALRDGRVDIVLSNWLWVSRERIAGRDWTLFPFSTSIGSVLVRPDSPIRSVGELKDARVGVAGTPHDENWLIMRILTTQKYGFDLGQAKQKTFGPPPAISEQLESGGIDAALTLWQFAARLEADGMRRVMSITDAIHELGIASNVPLLGYVFSEGWARKNPAAIRGFLQAAHEAQQTLANSDAEWERIAPLTRARGAAEVDKVRDAFRAGIPRRWGAAEQADAARLYSLLSTIEGAQTAIPAGTFFENVP